MFYCYRSFWVKGKRNNYLFITLIQYNLYSLSDARLFSLLLHVAKQKKKSYLLSAQQTCYALSGNGLFKSRALQNENQ